MKCKKCQAELTEGVSVCPECGAETAPSQSANNSKKLTVVIVALVVLIAVLVGVIVMGMGGIGGSEDTTAAPETTTADAATTPADGDPDGVTCKGSYTADAALVLAANQEIVATMGDHVLTNGQLQVYYWMSVYSFLGYNSYYLSYYGLDLTQGLDTQVCSIAEEEGITWQQYFLSEALAVWQCYQALTDDAEAAAFQLDQTDAEALEALRTSMEEAALADGYESLEAMVEDQLGGGCTFEDYETYMYQYYMGYGYYVSVCDAISVTDEQIREFFEENKEAYAENGLTEDYMYYDVRHVLIQPAESTTDESGTTTYTDEAWEACRVEAQALLDEWLANDGTEEGFSNMAKDHSVDGNASDGGIYTDLTTDTSFVTEFKEWYLDESRVPGDSGLVKTVYGYHLMYFVGSREAWPEYAESDLLTTLQNAVVDDSVANHPIEVDYSKILLGSVVLASDS